MKYLSWYAFIITSFALLLAGCGGGGGSATPATAGTTISGNVVKGPVTGATVALFALNADGSKGAQLGTTTTDADGNYTVTVTPAPTAPILVETSGGTYVDEATGATVTLTATDKLNAVLPVGTTRATVTPLTHIAAARALALAASGTPLATAVSSSNMGVAAQYGIADIVATLPPAANSASSVATANRDERIYALVLAGIAQQAKSVGVRALDLAKALAEDAKDGVLNGKNGTVAISVATISGSSLPLPATAGTTDIQTAINTFIASVNNKTNLTEIKIPLTAQNLGVNTAGRLYTTSPVLPAAVTGQTYTAGLTATGGTPPYSCALKAGSSLPAGYTLVQSTCQITGTAGIVASESITGGFIITITDSASPPNSVDLAPLYLTTVLPPPVLTFSALPTINEGTGGSLAVTATGGTTPYSFKFDSFLNGTPPFGATVDLFTGKVTIPTTAKAGNYNFGVCVVDLGGRSSCRTTAVTILPPAPAPAPTPTPTPSTPLTGTWKGTWAWSGPGSNGCQYIDGGSFTTTLTQTGTTFSGSTSGAGVQTRDNSTCGLILTETGTGTASGTISGTTLNLSFNLGVSNGAISFTGTGALNSNTLTATFARSTGGSGSFTLTRQ